MFRTYLVAYPWDVVDQGIEESLDRVQALGLTGITVHVTSGPVQCLRGWVEAEPRIFRTQGGFFFQPRAEAYQHTRLKPIVSSWLRSRNPLERIVEGCRKRRLELRVRLSAMGVGRIVQRHPEAAAKTAYGDPATVAMCPANPDVRALLRATITDLSRNYAPAMIELDDFCGGSGAFDGGGLTIGFNWGSAASLLLGLCFCESSLQSCVEHGVDASSAARWTRVELDRVLTQGVPWKAEGLEEKALADDVMRGYVRCQRSILDGLLGDLARDSDVGIAVLTPPSLSAPLIPSPQALGEAAALLVRADPADCAEPETFARVLAANKSTAAPCVEVEFNAAPMSAGMPSDLVRAVKQAADAGAAAASFSDLGLIPEAGFDAIKQAARYAQRS